MDTQNASQIPAHIAQAAQDSHNAALEALSPLEALKYFGVDYIVEEAKRQQLTLSRYGDTFVFYTLYHGWDRDIGHIFRVKAQEHGKPLTGNDAIMLAKLPAAWDRGIEAKSFDYDDLVEYVSQYIDMHILAYYQPENLLNIAKQAELEDYSTFRKRLADLITDAIAYLDDDHKVFYSVLAEVEKVMGPAKAMEGK